MAKNVELVSPDGKQKRVVGVDSKQEINLRWDGWTTAPEPEPEAPKAQAVARRGAETSTPAA